MYCDMVRSLARLSRLFFDINLRDKRNPAVPVRRHSSTHSDDINLVKFHPFEPSRLLSGSADGLLCISNSQEDDEDEAVVQVVNWGCSISRAGWFGSNDGSERVWSASDMETMAIWSQEVSGKSPLTSDRV